MKKATSKNAKAKLSRAMPKKATPKTKKAGVAKNAKKKGAKNGAALKKGAAKPNRKRVAPQRAPRTKKSASTSTKKRAASAIPVVPATRPSERAMAVAAQLPEERALTDEERDAMSKVAQTALATLATDDQPERIVASIAAFVDEIRGGVRPEPDSQDLRLGLGVLWGEQVRARVGWRWVHLSYPNGFASYALVPDDRAFACFPLNRLAELMKDGSGGVNTSAPLFDSIRVGALPTRHENAYLVIG